MKTIVLEELPEFFWQLVKEEQLESNFVASDYPNLAEIRIAIIRTKVKFTHQLMDTFPNLQFIIRAGTGIDNVDLISAKKRNIRVTNTPDANAQCAFEHTLALLSAMMKNLQAAKKNILSDAWKSGLRTNFEFSELRVLVVGLGRVGWRVAFTLRLLGAKVKAVDPYLGKGFWKRYQIEETAYEEGLKWCNVLTFHCPLNKETENYFNISHLSLLNEPIFLLNTARGCIVSNSACSEGLSRNLFLGIGIDVFENEPCDIKNWFSDERVYLTPHCGSQTDPAKKRLSYELLEVWNLNALREKNVAEIVDFSLNKNEI
jgi:D-3-phosphoglycerate dehydrogenase